MNRTHVPVSLAFDYELRPAAGERPAALILLLHGYLENGRSILRPLEEALPDDAVVLAPHGIFPQPQLFRKPTHRGVRWSYAWYFYNSFERDYYMDMRYAVEFLAQGVRELGYADLPKIVIGFSQGGYLAPVVAERLEKVRQVIGIGSEFLTEELKEPEKSARAYRIDALHGEDDDKVSLADSLLGFEGMKKIGFAGEFHRFPGAGHEITPEMRETIRRILVRSTAPARG